MKKDDGYFFAEAFLETVRDIGAPVGALDRVQSILRDGLFNGDATRPVLKRLAVEMPEASWSWPTFNDQFGDQDSARMLGVLLNRVWRLASAKARAHRFTPDVLPYKIFNAQRGRSPPECLALDGVVKRHDDPFWEQHLTPCSRLDCMCTWNGLTERSARERGTG